MTKLQFIILLRKLKFSQDDELCRGGDNNFYLSLYAAKTIADLVWEKFTEGKDEEIKTYTIEAKDKKGIVWSFMSQDLQGIKVGDTYIINTPIRRLQDLKIINIKENPEFVDVTG